MRIAFLKLFLLITSFAFSILLPLSSLAQLYAPSGSVAGVTNGTTNVGIGTSLPDMKLMVTTTNEWVSRFESTGSQSFTGIRLGRKGPVTTYTDFVNSATGFGISTSTVASSLTLNTQNSDYIQFFIDHARKNVGIGTVTPYVHSQLDIAGPYLINKHASQLHLHTTNNASGMYLGSYNSSLGYISVGSHYSTSGNMLPLATTAVGIHFLDGKIRFYSDSGLTPGGAPYAPTVRMVIEPSGHLGLGVTSPTAPLHIVKAGQSIRFLTGTNTSGYQLDIGVNDDGVNMVNNSSARGFKFGNSTGTLLTIEEDGDLVMNKGGITVDTKQVGIRNATPKTDLVVGNNYGASISGSSGGRGVFGSNLAVYGYYAGNNNNQLYTPYQHNSGYGYSGMAATWGRLDFYANGGNTVEGQIITEAPRMTISKTGNVGIGTTSPDAKLTVKGDIHAQEVKIDLNGALTPPDYVFEENYPLMSLEEIEKYIQANKHLPEVPSAKEMEQNGVKLLEMNMLLLKKVEELTLLLIEQQKQNINQDKKIIQLEKQLNNEK